MFTAALFITANKMSFRRRVDKPTGVHPDNGIPLSAKKKKKKKLPNHKNT